MAGYEVIAVAVPTAIAGFIVVPVAAWFFAFAHGTRAWRAALSEPLETPPRIRGDFVRWMYATVIADPIAFGLGLWLLWAPSAQALDTGGAAGSIGAAFLVLEGTCLAFSGMSWITAISQALVFSRNVRTYLGPGSARASILLVVPALGSLLALVVGFQGVTWAGSFLSDPTIPNASVADPVIVQFLVFLCAAVAILAAAIYSRRDVSTTEGFRAAAIVAVLGLVPPLAAAVWMISQAPPA